MVEQKKKALNFDFYNVNNEKKLAYRHFFFLYAENLLGWQPREANKNQLSLA